jgi:predicted small integral membrane protein
MCFPSLVHRPTALGMILAVFSFEIFVTDWMGIWSCKQRKDRGFERRRFWQTWVL